jgi:Bacterial regulatory proteins, luxR family
VSLGLSNRQISEVLHLGEATVKSHLHSLLNKLELSDREDLGLYFAQALAPFSPPKRWREIQPKRWKCEPRSPTNSGAKQQTRRDNRSAQIASSS